MIVQIDIDGVLRDLILPIESYFAKDFENRKIHKDVSSYNLLDIFEFVSQEELDNWLFEKRVFEIFGQAPQYNNSINHLNKLLLHIPEYTVWLVNKQIGRSIPATLYWLSRYGSQVKNIQFVNDEINKIDENFFPNILIEDNVSVIEKFLQECTIIDRIKMNNYQNFIVYKIKQPWNEKFTSNSIHYREANSFIEIVDELIEINNKNFSINREESNE